MAETSAAPATAMQKMLDLVERVGNRVPHPVIIFVILIGIVIVLSHLFYMLGLSVSYQRINPETHEVEDITTVARSLLTVDGIRFMFTGVVQNFMNFNAVGVIIVAMVGVGVAEENGPDQGADPQAGGRRAAAAAHLHPGVRGHSLEHRRRCRLPGPDPARGGGVPQRRAPSARRPRGGLRGGRRGVPGQRPDRAGGRHPDRDHQRRDPPGRSRGLDRPRRQRLVLDRLGDHADHRDRADHRAHRRAAPRPVYRRLRARGREHAVCRRVPRAALCPALGCSA